MKKQKIIIPPEVIADLNKYAKNVAKNMAIAVKEDIAKRYVYLIDTFYTEYTPEYYVRVHGLYNSFKKFYKNLHNSVFYGGIEISDTKMLDDNYKAEKATVLASFLSGYHGLVSLNIHFATEPEKDILDYRDEIYFNISRYNDNAIKKAQMENYKVLRW